MNDNRPEPNDPAAIVVTDVPIDSPAGLPEFPAMVRAIMSQAADGVLAGSEKYPDASQFELVVGTSDASGAPIMMAHVRFRFDTRGDKPAN